MIKFPAKAIGHGHQATNAKMEPTEQSIYEVPTLRTYVNQMLTPLYGDDLT